MSDALMWFGTKDFATWVPAPDSGMDRTTSGKFWEHRPDNGGRVVKRTRGGAVTISPQWTSLRSDGPAGLWRFNEFATGLHGDGYLYFLDPMVAPHNVFSPQWAAPGLMELGLRRILNFPIDFSTNKQKTPSFIDTPANSNGYPRRSAVLPELSGLLPEGYSQTPFTIFVPPGYKLMMTAVGGRVPGDPDTSPMYSPLVVRYFDYGRSPLGSNAVTLQTVSQPPQMSTYGWQHTAGFYAEVSIINPGVPFVLTALMAQVVPIDQYETPVLFKPGLGYSGMDFMGEDAAPETYILANEGRYISSLSSDLGEVEQWTRTR